MSETRSVPVCHRTIEAVAVWPITDTQPTTKPRPCIGSACSAWNPWTPGGAGSCGLVESCNPEPWPDPAEVTPRCGCTHEEGDSPCAVHASCPECGSLAGSDPTWRTCDGKWQHRCAHMHPQTGHAEVTP